MENNCLAWSTLQPIPGTEQLADCYLRSGRFTHIGLCRKGSRNIAADVNSVYKKEHRPLGEKSRDSPGYQTRRKAAFVRRSQFWSAFISRALQPELMNPITSTVAASCNRLVLSPRTSPRCSPRPSPNVTRKTPFLDLPAEEKKRRDSKEIEDYKKQLAGMTSQAYKEKKTENKKSNHVGKPGSNPAATKKKPTKRLLEEAVAIAATAEKRKHGEKTTNSKPSKSSSSSASTKEKKCTIM